MSTGETGARYEYRKDGTRQPHCRQCGREVGVETEAERVGLCYECRQKQGQTTSNACWQHDCENCGLFAPNGKPCACECHQTNGDTERYDYWTPAPAELAPGVAQFREMYDAAQPGEMVGYCFRCGQPFTGEQCPRCDSSAPASEATEEEAGEPDEEEQLERHRLDYADNMAISNMDPADRAYLENWPRSRDDYDDYADDIPSEKQLENWREANEYVNEGEEPDDPEPDGEPAGEE